MTTVIINEKVAAGRKALEQLRGQSFAKIVDERRPNAKLERSFEEGRTGKFSSAKTEQELREILKAQIK